MNRLLIRVRSGQVCVLFAAFLVCGSAFASPVQPEVAEEGSVIVIADTAEVREGPGPAYEVVTIVERGEVFAKRGRTGGWYLVLISGEATGWINGRAVQRHEGDGSAPARIGPYEDRFAPDSPFWYGPYSSYYWVQPYFSWEWYYYGDSHRDRWRYDRWDSHRDRDRGRDDDGRRREDRHWNDGGGHRPNHPFRPSSPRIRGPIQRR